MNAIIKKSFYVVVLALLLPVHQASAIEAIVQPSTLRVFMEVIQRYPRKARLVGLLGLLGVGCAVRRVLIKPALSPIGNISTTIMPTLPIVIDANSTLSSSVSSADDAMIIGEKDYKEVPGRIIRKYFVVECHNCTHQKTGFLYLRALPSATIADLKGTWRVGKNTRRVAKCKHCRWS